MKRVQSPSAATTALARVRRSSFLASLPLAVPAIQIAALLFAIWTQTPRVPVGDEWAMVPLLEHADAGTLSFGDFWAVFNRSHRVVLPRLVELGLIHATQWNRQIMMSFDLAVAVAAGALVFLCLREIVRSQAALLALLVPLSLFYLSFAQYENWFLPWQLAFITTVLGACCTMYGFFAASRSEGDNTRVASVVTFGVALAGAVIASLATFGGLLVWAAFLPSAARAGRVRLAIWLACAMAIGIPYVVGLAGGPLTSPIHSVAFLLAMIGSPFWSSSLGLARVFGLFGLAAMPVGLYLYWRLYGELWSILLWMELAAFALLSDAVTALARTGYGNAVALASRYEEFTVLWWIALCVIMALVVMRVLASSQAMSWREGLWTQLRGEGFVRVATALSIATLVLCLAGALFADLDGVPQGLAWLAPRAHQACLLQSATPTDACMDPYFDSGLVPVSNAELMAYIRTHHLAIFAR